MQPDISRQEHRPTKTYMPPRTRSPAATRVVGTNTDGKKSSAAAAPSIDVLQGYLLLYASYQLYNGLVYWMPLELLATALSMIACVGYPSYPAVAMAAHGSFVLRCLWKAPNIFNGDIWGATMDIGFILTCVTFIGPHRLATPLTSASQRDALAREIFAVMGNCLVWFYLGAGVWKMNYGFLDTQGSCAPIYILQLVDAYLPSALLPPMPVIQLINDTAPALVILVEAGIGVLMHFPGRLQLFGVALGVLLHGLIAITPGPNNAGGFGVMLLARYYAFLPDALAQAMTEVMTEVTAGIRSGGSRLRYVSVGAVVLAAFLPLVVRSADHTFFIDWSLPVYAVQTLLFARALLLEYRGAGRRGKGSAPMGKPVTGAATPTTLGALQGGAQRVVRQGFAIWMVVYTFGLPMLGLQDMGNVHMFASLRLHGGSNHIFLPTGLLQQWLHDASPLSPWSGGVVRVERVTSPHMANTYPAEVTHILTPRVRQLLIASGHTGT